PLTPPPHIYTLSLHDALPIFYDKTFFDAHGIAAPTTWNEFIDACWAIKDAGALPMYIALKRNDAQWFWPTGMIGNFAMRSKVEEDRKSTRLNSSHVKISYAVF